MRLLLGFVLAANVANCAKKYRTAVQISQCPEGFIRKRLNCVKPQPVAKEIQCEHGSLHPKTKLCSVEVPGNATCDKGSYAGNLKCELVQKAEGSYVCPKNSVLEDGKCYVHTSLSHCPPGTATMPEGDCQMFTPKGFKCPEGSKETGRICAATTYSDPTIKCPRGTKPINSRCATEIVREPVCPEDSADIGDTCVRKGPSILTCPQPGFELKDHVCVKYTTIAADMRCHHGGRLSEDSAHCEKWLKTPRTAVCDDGVLLGDGTCLVTSTLSASFRCPHGYSSEDGSCVKRVDYDCSITKSECGAEVQLESGEHRLSLGLNSSVHSSYCAKVNHFVKKMCQERRTAQQLPICSSGVYAGSGLCRARRFVKPRMECTTGVENRDGECAMVESYPAAVTCPRGFVPNGTNCASGEAMAPVESCEADETKHEDGCATFIEKSCPPDGCVVHVYADGTAVCPDGYTLRNGGNGGDVRCVKNTYVHKVGVCAEGTLPFDETTCYQIHPPVVFEQGDPVDAQFVCPLGYATTADGICEFATFHRANIQCPPSYRLAENSDLCLLEESPELVCPAGAKEIEGECWLEMNVAPYYVETAVLPVNLW